MWMPTDKQRFYGFICVVIVATVSFYQLFQITISDISPEYVHPPVIRTNDSGQLSLYTILWYNAPPWIQTMNKHVSFKGCTFKNCKMLEDRKRAKESDAVIFSLPTNGIDKSPPLKIASPGQMWIFFSLESPAHTRRLSNDWTNVFNWSWTYRTDADIFYPYGYVKKRQNLLNKKYTEIFRSKTGFVAWLVSNCNTTSEREEYVRLLKKYVPVDVYGKCGTIISGGKQAVMDMFNRKYKFYLSFENSLCQDYVTEKFFKYSTLDIVPVVRGGAAYDLLFPNNTYINTAHFPSVKKLADYLLHVGSDEIEYTDYLRRKDLHDYLSDASYQNSLCQLCMKLNNREKFRSFYPDYRKWMGTCQKPVDIIDVAS